MKSLVANVLAMKKTNLFQSVIPPSRSYLAGAAFLKANCWDPQKTSFDPSGWIWLDLVGEFVGTLPLEENGVFSFGGKGPQGFVCLGFS